MLLGFFSGFALLAVIGWLIKKRCDKIPEGQIAQHFAPCQRSCRPCMKALSACASGCGTACGQCCDPLCGECCSTLCKNLEKYEIEPEQWPECCTCCHPPYECCPKEREHEDTIELRSTRSTRVTFSEDVAISLVYEHGPLNKEEPTEPSPESTSEFKQPAIIAQPGSAKKTKEHTNIDMNAYAQTQIPSGDRHLKEKSKFLLGTCDPDLPSSQPQPGTSHGHKGHQASWWRPTFKHEDSSSSNESLTSKFHTT